MYEVLIGTESFYDEGAAHLTTTLINVESAATREDRYKDVVGFKTNKIDALNSSNEFMIGQIEQLNKNLVLIEHHKNKSAGKIFYKNADGKYLDKKIHIHTANDINFDIWLDTNSCYWNPVDVLLDGAQDDLHSKINTMYDEIMSIKNIINMFRKDI